MTNSTILNIAHISTQAQDSDPHRRADARAIFERAADEQYHWVGGTEGGELVFRAAAKLHASRAGFFWFQYKSRWIAVNKRLVVPGSYKAWGETIMKNDRIVGKMHDPALALAEFRIEDVGLVTNAVGHYPRFGRPSGNAEYQRNLDENREIARYIGRTAKQRGAGRCLFFYQGDQNILDNIDDTFMGQPLTSIQDELKTWPNTGHGPIDVFASYDEDGRVKANYLQVLNDRKFFLHGDHFWMQAGWAVKTLT